MKLLGNKIFLRSLTEQDVYGRWWKWFNDPEVTRFMNKGIEKNTPEKQLRFFNNITDNERFAVYAICEKKSAVHIGTVGLHNIDFRTKEGQFGIIIGEKLFWGKGVGGEAWSLMVDFGFKELELERIHTKIFSKNDVSIKIAERCGFEKTKKIRGDINKEGNSYDRLQMVLTRAKWSTSKNN
jgi:[ribosomal protein S5]-alanine N-acetyltransferase